MEDPGAPAPRAQSLWSVSTSIRHRSRRTEAIPCAHGSRALATNPSTRSRLATGTANRFATRAIGVRVWKCRAVTSAVPAIAAAETRSESQTGFEIALAQAAPARPAAARPARAIEPLAQ